ncbi:MAG: mannose-1-phosphate guanylyltransferase [Planctomycetes bacterium]|nr:mannose-1-phosphate guanylyltransferase [Planctomycetota bacterium]
MLYAVIMAGGSGTRFWPASRQSFPKQLLPIGTRRPLVEETLDRISRLVSPEQTLIVTNASYAKMTNELLSEVPEENVIGEPTGRDTAACIGLAALILKKRDPDAVMAVMPSDHIISPAEGFCFSLEGASILLEENPHSLITFGIKPTFPSTGYGYIRRGGMVGEVKGLPFYQVDAFEEKPDQDRAEMFLRKGGYYWNAGIFLWRADTILEVIAHFLPTLDGGLKQIEPHVDQPDFNDILAAVYPTLPKISIDFGVMEKAESRIVAEVNYTWDDVGSWRALERLLDPDDLGNCCQGESICIEATNNIVSSRGGLVGLVGVDGLIVVHTPDATLVCRKEDAEMVKKLVEALDSEYR